MKDKFCREINYLRISVTDRCNLSCRYCTSEYGNDNHHHDDFLDMEQMLEVAEAASELGVTKIRLTGGEPLLFPDIIELCTRLSAIPEVEDLAISTNAILLPMYAAKLKSAGLRRVNISLDTLNPKKYAQMTRCGSLQDTLIGIKSALDIGFDTVKINTVLIGGFNDDEITNLAELTCNNDIQLRFIELMPIGVATSIGKNAFIPVSTVTDRLPALIEERTEGVARVFRLPGYRGTIGLISPISRHFCTGCNRLRLTADGYLKPCLHTAQEISVRNLHGEELKAAILDAVRAKPKCHGLLSYDSLSESKRSMYRIGG